MADDGTCDRAGPTGAEDGGTDASGGPTPYNLTENGAFYQRTGGFQMGHEISVGQVWI